MAEMRKDGDKEYLLRVEKVVQISPFLKTEEIYRETFDTLDELGQALKELKSEEANHEGKFEDQAWYKYYLRKAHPRFSWDCATLNTEEDNSVRKIVGN